MSKQEIKTLLKTCRALRAINIVLFTLSILVYALIFAKTASSLSLVVFCLISIPLIAIVLAGIIFFYDCWELVIITSKFILYGKDSKYDYEEE